MLNLIWREEARAESRQIFQYIADHDFAAAERLLAAIETCAQRIPRQPYMYRPGRVAGTTSALPMTRALLAESAAADMSVIANTGVLDF
ncbi:type II toxin-antitoxin system RelE/ParE family toxin [Sphingomonas tabacisoli]|uniref:Type II toxin-antitoxin system RelE/ParE family toxin n=1 Tax=Sphingomonas tabacisoli TaxID=2249466 RepID=A0ABW4HZ29_9SPHN